MADLPPISVELQGKIADLMAKFAIVKREINSIKDASLRLQSRDIADSLVKSMKDAAIKDAIKKQMSDNGRTAGDSFWTGFRRAWQKGLKQENAERGFWGNLMKWTLPVAPAIVPTLTGLVGVLGGIGTAGVGAAAGLGALGLAAKEVLGPVQNAFTTIDKYTVASNKTGQNLIASNAYALRLLAKQPATSGLTTAASKQLKSQIQAEQLRVQASQYRLAHATTLSSRLDAQATLLSEQRILSGYKAKLSPTSQALPKNLQFLTNPNVNWYTMTPAQRNALILASQHTTGLPASEKSQITALMTERQAFIGLNPGQRQALYQTQHFDSTAVHAMAAAQPSVLKLYGGALSAFTPVLKYITPLANAAASALMPLIKEVGAGFKTTGFKDFVNILIQMAKLGIAKIGQALIDFGVGLAHIFMAFGRSNVPKNVLNDLVEMADHFRNWTGGKNFAAFMSGVKTDTPIVSDLLRNLQQILAKIIGSMATGIGVWELKGLDALATTLNWIVHIPGLGHVIGNLLALQLLLSRFGAVKAESFVFSFLLKKILLLIPGIELVDGKLTGMGAVWSKVWGKVSGWVSSAASTIGGAIANISKALWANLVAGAKWAAGMIARMATAVAAWLAGLLGIDTATAASTTFIIGATGGLILVVAAIVLAIYELYKHWGTVWGFIKRISEDVWNFLYKYAIKYIVNLFGPKGPIIAAIRAMGKGWNAFWAAFKTTAVTSWQWIDNHAIHPLIRIWDDVAKALHSFSNFMDVWSLRIQAIFAGWAKNILHYINDAFGWVPNWVPGAGALKAGLKAAETDIQNFVNQTQNKLNQLTKQPHNVKIKFGIGGSAAAEAGGGKIINAFAGGTSGAAPGWAWVGERGPELVRMRGGETVIPNHRIGGYAAGTGSDLSFTTSVPSASAVNNVFAAIDRIGNKIATNIAAVIEKHLQRQMRQSSPGFGIAPNGAVQQYARKLLAAYGWSNQWNYFNDIVMRESGWNTFATNPGSGAYGIPQALPGSKMAAAGADWRTNPFTQIRWMMGYLRSRWGSPFNADMNEIQNHWYGDGGRIPPGQWGIVGERGTPELVSVGAHGATVVPMRSSRGSGRPILIQVFTQEINPVKHAADLGFELARRSA